VERVTVDLTPAEQEILYHLLSEHMHYLGRNEGKRRRGKVAGSDPDHREKVRALQVLIRALKAQSPIE
jgi:hypothetical protein